MKLRESAKSSAAAALLADMAAGTTGLPALELLTTPVPSALGDTVTATILASLEMSDGVGTSAGGVITFGLIGEVNATELGAIGWARMLDKDGAEVLHLTTGLAGSGADVIISEENVMPGSPVSVSMASILVGE